MIKHCSVELFGDRKIVTNYFNLNKKMLQRVQLLGQYDEYGAYEATYKELQDIVNNTEIIFLRNPENLVEHGKIAYQELYDMVDNPARIRPYRDFNNPINIKFNGIPVKMNSDKVSFSLEERDILSTSYMWHTAFLTSFAKIHRGKTDYTIEASSDFTHSSDVDELDLLRTDLKDKYYTLSMTVYEFECAYYLVPVKIFSSSKGKVSPVKFSGSKELRDAGYVSHFKFMIDKDYLSIDLLKQLKRYGSLVGGSALYNINEDDIGGFNYNIRYMM